MTTTTTITVHRGDIRTVMAAMPDNCVDLIVTSPPFLALRSYLPADHPDKPFEIGSEATPAAFIDTLLELSAEWRRIVVGSGSIAVEIGDTYSGSGGDNHLYEGSNPAAGFNGSVNQGALPGVKRQSSGWPLAKSLCMIPELYGVALAYGHNPITGAPSPAGRWRVRNWLTWTRPNPPVGALGDKFRPATSFVTVACISDKRWFDLDAVRQVNDRTSERPMVTAKHEADLGRVHKSFSDKPAGSEMAQNPAGAPPLDWHHDDWQPLHRLPTAPYAGAHYATYPLALPSKLIEAMCPPFVCSNCSTPYGVNHELRGMRNPLQAQPRPQEVLRQAVRQPAHGTDTVDDSRIRHHSEGLPRPVGARASDGTPDGIRARTPGRNGRTPGASVDAERGGSSPEWGQARQQDRELGDVDEGGARPDAEASAGTARVPALRRVDPNATECPACGGDLRPGRVCDPFAGSGTTLLAAALAGRDAIGIDLDSRNLDLIRHRIGEAVLIVSERVDGDTVTFTVNRHMPGTKGEAEGQTSLFAEESA